MSLLEIFVALILSVLPTPEPTLYELAYEVSGSYEFAAFVLPISYCESRQDSSQVNTESGATGLMQIHPVHKSWIGNYGYNWEDMRDTRKNLHVAWILFRDYGHKPWQGCLHALDGSGM